MKTRSILFATLSVAVLSSCAGKVSDMTEIKGTAEGFESVNVVVGETVDTLVGVVDGRFSVSVPADVTAYGVVRTVGGQPERSVFFIPDGTPLEVVLAEETSVKSKCPKVSVQERFNAYNADEETLMAEYKAMVEEVQNDTLLTEEQKSAKFDEFFAEFDGRYYGHHKAALQANTDNFIGVYALSSLRGQLEDTEMADLIASLAPAIQDNRSVKAMKKALDARIATAEGSMFKDFTVETVYGYSRSIPAQPLKKEVKFSDYVGKGTYVLVDFWSPWCGPCRREVPNIKSVYDRYKDKGLEVLSLAVWERREQSHTMEVAGELGMDWLHVNNCGSVPTDIYGVEGIPHLMLIGPDGTILKRGFHGAEGIEAAVAEYIK